MASKSIKDMALTEVADEVRAVVRDLFGRDIADKESSLAEAGIDSLALLDLLAELETRFGVHLTENMVAEFQTIGRVARVVQDVAKSS